MSDFLLIFPEGWNVIDFDLVYSLNPDFNVTNVDNWVATNQLSYIEEILKAVGQIDATATVVGAKRFDSYFAVLLG